MHRNPEKKKIIIDDGLSTLNGCTGVGNYSRVLYESLNDYIAKAGEMTEVEYRNYPFFRLFPRKIRRALYLYAMTTLNQFTKTSVVHFTNFYTPPVRFTKARFIVTIHDMAAWMFPEAFTSGYLRFIRPVITKSVAKADRIITVSNTVKKEIVEVFGTNKGKIDVCYNAVRSVFKRVPKFRTKQKYLLFVGNIDAQKNVPTLVKAFANLRKVPQYSDLGLIIVGKKRAGFGDLSLAIQRENVDEYVSIVGYVSDEELVRLYQEAELLVIPSFYEGFGIPIIEAMASGVPVIASDIPVFREVAGDCAYFYGSPNDDSMLFEAMKTLLYDKSLCQTLIRKGTERVQRFSPQEFARRHIEVYDAVCR